RSSWGADSSMRRAGAVCVFVCALALLTATPASAQLSRIETQDLRLLYRDPLQAYLVDHVGRCFINSLDFETRLVGYHPSAQITVLLNDFSDAGNASASAIPHNTLLIETAPISVAY